ncbi:MAG: hypothetical protein AB7I42_26130 [Bradyrhizobium sp.]|uniref:hypothetical protein n=1 Tax=Bradyrhizobium sp. TaxID=376 RepID=UPI003D0B5405
MAFPKIEYVERVIRAGNEEILTATLNQMGEFGWEAWFMKEWRDTDMCRWTTIYFRRHPEPITRPA